ncbi:MAG: Protein containing Heat shock protein Hsp20 protein [Parcubacteria group bacterium GW2011_GWA2_47_7]|nr:MAG: Protein containing Heat shock protein Hsp20 protein [Parcubacteria group bacterium GW2011_GWA2_47_7]
MKERKQSFLERLTGAQIVDDGDTLTEQKIWTPAPTEEESFVKQDDDISSDEAEGEQVEAGLAIDMYETDNELIIQSMIAGVTPENLHISITRNAVTITGNRLAPNVPEGNYLERELYWGVFTREIILPFEIDTDGAEAVEKYGLLIIRLPKLDSNSAQVLKVKSI